MSLCTLQDMCYKFLTAHAQYPDIYKYQVNLTLLQAKEEVRVFSKLFKNLKIPFLLFTHWEFHLHLFYISMQASTRQSYENETADEG